MKPYEQSHKTPKFERLFFTLTGNTPKARKCENEQNTKPYRPKTENHIPAADQKQKPEHRQRIRSSPGNLDTITNESSPEKPESIPGRNESRKPSEIYRPEPPKSYPQSTRTAPANFSKNHPSIFPIFKNFQKFFGRSGDTKNIGGYQKALHYIFARAQNFFKKISEPATATAPPGVQNFLADLRIMQTNAITEHYSRTDANLWGIPKSCAIMQTQIT